MPSAPVEDRIIQVRKALVKWSREQHLNSRKKIEKHKSDLDAAMSSSINNEDLIQKINGDLKKTYLDE